MNPTIAAIFAAAISFSGALFCVAVIAFSAPEEPQEDRDRVNRSLSTTAAGFFILGVLSLFGWFF